MECAVATGIEVVREVVRRVCQQATGASLRGLAGRRASGVRGRDADALAEPCRSGSEPGGGPGPPGFRAIVADWSRRGPFEMTVLIFWCNWCGC
jgi:hypothetical protein